MERYKLKDCFDSQDTLYDDIEAQIDSTIYEGIEYRDALYFVATSIYGYFYDDLIAYPMSDNTDITTFIKRLSYDISVKLLYWYRKYNYIKKLLTDDELSLFQTSKVTSSSQDNTASASGSLQKIATTPTGVSTGTAIDNIDITINVDTNKDSSNEVETQGFADKYSNTQQKFASANNIKGERSGNITREGSIDELLNVLEKLPSSFADEVTKAVGKHFIFDYDGEERSMY